MSDLIDVFNDGLHEVFPLSKVELGDWRKWPYYQDYWYRYPVEEKDEPRGELVEDYCEYVLTENEKLAVEMGAMNAFGLLTHDGKELLVELFNDDENVKEAFFKVLRKLKEKKNAEQTRANRGKSTEQSGKKRQR